LTVSAGCAIKNASHPGTLGYSMRISFNQPCFLPWGGFFARLLHSDRMVLLDDTLLARGFTYVNRNRIKGPSGEAWISVPLRRKGRGRQKIKDLEIFEKKRWARDFLLTVRHFYAASLYLGEILREMETALQREDENFLSMVIAFLDILKKGFDIPTDFVMQSRLRAGGKGADLLVALAGELDADEVLMPYFSRKAVDWTPFRKEKIRIRFLRYDPPRYPQFWGPFLKRLSALDLFLCCGPLGKKIIERGASLY